MTGAERLGLAGQACLTAARCLQYPDPAWFDALGTGGLLALLGPGAGGAATPLYRQVRRLRLAARQDLSAHPDRSDWEGEYNRLFALGPSVLCPPTETEYTAAHVFMQTNQMADVAGFYRAFGLDVAPGGEQVDHISAEFELLGVVLVKEAVAADLGEADRVAVCRASARSFLTDHLGRWAGAFADALASQAGFAFYRRLGPLLAALVARECGRLEAAPVPVAGRARLGRAGLGREFDFDPDRPGPVPVGGGFAR